MTDLLLYVIIDVPSLEKRTVLSIPEYAECLLQAGVKILQLRDKDSPLDIVEQRAKAILSLTSQYDAAFFLNDYPSLAAKIGAAGVHVGQTDTAVKDVKHEYPELLVGASARTVEEARRAAAQGAYYIGCGPIWDAKTSKPDAPDPIGLEQLKHVACSVQIPVVGIGGITGYNAVSVIEANAAGVAVIRETLPLQHNPTLHDLEAHRSRIKRFIQSLQQARVIKNEKR